MQPLLLFLVLSLAAMAWAFYSKIRRQMLVPSGERDFTELITIILPAIAVLVNAVLVYRLVTVGLSVNSHLIQMLACCSIVPLVYMHFAYQVGRPLLNSTTTILWLLCLLVLLPRVVLCDPYTAYEPLHFTPKPFAIYLVSHGEKLWAIYTGDMVVIIQSVVTILRVLPLAHSLRKSGLRLSRSVYAFFVWWFLTATYIAVVSSLNLEQLTSAGGIWFYYLGMTISIIGINTLLALNFDLHPIETEQGEAIESVEAYLDKLYIELSHQMETMMAEEQLFRHPGFMVEDMCERLNTSRKMLSQMMLRHHGIHFPEYLNNLRLQYAQQLLLTTDMKIEIVSEESGFADRSYMNRLWKQKFNSTPSQWAKENKQS